MKKQEAFWLKQFEGTVPLLNIPCDNPRPESRNFDGRGFFFKFGTEITEDIKKNIQKWGISLQIFMVEVFHVLLSKLSGQEDIVTGTTIAGRVHPDLEMVIGLFANTLALRTYPSGKKIFSDYLKEVRDMSLGAYENQDYPLEELVAKVAADWDRKRNPLFDIMFEIQSGGAADQGDSEIIELLTNKAGVKFLPYAMETATTKFEQDWVGSETKDGISFGVKYNSTLFQAESIELMADQFMTLVQNVLKNPDCRIEDLDHHSDVEKQLKEVQDLSFNF
jgi:non-ribosomal peptide synthetase component F